MTRADTQKRNMRSWYENNKEKLREKRKDNYQNDPEFRERALNRAQAYREARAQGEVPTRTYERMHNGVLQTVYSVGVVAAELGTYPQMIINWEQRGWIPKPIFSENHRLYTEHQRDLLSRFHDAYELYRKTKPKNQEILDTVSYELDDEWNW